VGIINGKNMQESGRDLIKVLSHNFLGGSEENNKNAQSDCPVSLSIFEPATQ
jgi:hypothetical protein